MECVYLGVRVVYVCYVEVYVGVVYKCMGCRVWCVVGVVYNFYKMYTIHIIYKKHGKAETRTPHPHIHIYTPHITLHYTPHPLHTTPTTHHTHYTPHPLHTTPTTHHTHHTSHFTTHHTHYIVFHTSGSFIQASLPCSMGMWNTIAFYLIAYQISWDYIVNEGTWLQLIFRQLLIVVQ